jgi:signal transduction histidine kinase
LLYSAALIFVAAFVRMVLQADEARRRSEQFLAELKEAHAQLQAFAGQAEELAIANERTRLARDLHDSVAQTLYGLTLQSEAASRKLAAGQSDAVQTYLDQIQEDAKQTLQETRLLIFELRPPILESSGLAAALKARLDSVEARSGLTMQLNLEEISGLPSHVETGLYRIAQEALNNAARHAGSGKLNVLLMHSNGVVILEIADDGVGFDTAAVPAGSVGLKGMAERVEQLNGRMTIESGPQKGTKVRVEIPL